MVADHSVEVPTPRLTERLRLQPIGLPNAADLWRVHQDPGIAQWYAGAGSETEARESAAAMDQGWAHDGVSKWLAYHRANGELTGRGGLSRSTVDGRDCLAVGWRSDSDSLWGRGTQPR